MKYLTIPLILTTVLALTVQLNALAENSTDKAVSFASDVNDAIDCALRGVEIELCSPGILNTSFEPELEEFTSILQNISAEGDVVLLEGQSVIISEGEAVAFVRFDETIGDRALFTYVITAPTLYSEHFNLTTGEVRGLDINNDTLTDITLTLIDVVDEAVELSLEGPPSGIQVTANVVLGTGAEKSRVTPLWIIPLIMAFIILVTRHTQKKSLKSARKLHRSRKKRQNNRRTSRRRSKK